MRTRFLAGLGLLLLTLTGFSQSLLSGTLQPGSGTRLPSIRKCATEAYMDMLRKGRPGAESDLQFEQFMARKIAERRSDPALNNVVNYTIPVVFHILHEGNAVGQGNNLSEARIRAQLAQINKDFANLSGSPYGVSSATGIQFVLAQRNPQGIDLPEPGINRINRPVQGLPAGPYTIAAMNQVKQATFWDPFRYLNIWVAELSGGILGFATFPTSSGLPGLFGGETDANAGVVIVPTTVGSYTTPFGTCSLTSPYNSGKTLTHELGHFFGLRHIWGDARCGNDFCDDTPVHEDENRGVPTHPKPNGCGTPDEMFENYMDYTNDEVLNTFTKNQVDRMQVVMVNSPRRRELPNSNAGAVGFTSNRLSFLPCRGAITVTETGNTGDCPRFKIIQIPLSVEDRASGNATVTLQAAGSATAGVDYELLTPSVSFAAGDGVKFVQIRIIDDLLAEDNETIVLSYAISGSGVSAGSVAQTLTITLQDDDNVFVSQNPVTLLDVNFQSAAGWTSLTSQGARNKFNLGVNGTGMTDNSLYITSDFSTGPLASHSYSIDEASLAVARSPEIDARSLKNMKLSFKWVSEGEVEDDEPYDFGALVTFPPASNSFSLLPNTPILAQKSTVQTVNLDLPANLNFSRFHMGWLWSNDDNTGTQPPLAFDDVLLTGEATKVESQQGHSRSAPIPQGIANAFLLSTQDQEIIARIGNPSLAINCVTATVTQAGTGQVDLQTDLGVFKRSAKVIQINTPGGAFNGTYSLTLYFTQAEIAVWGDQRANLRVMQVNDGVNLAGGVNGSNARLLTPTNVSDLLLGNGYIAYTVNATGFSQFFLVSPETALPLQWTDFRATPAAKSIRLQWSTRQEYNNRGFDIERSTDGQRFESIGYVAGRGFTATPGNFDYVYEDLRVSPGITYWYRLRQTDIDGRSTLSAVRNARLDAAGNWTVFPNPSKGQVRLVPAQPGTTSVELLDARGRVLKSWSRLNLPAQGTELNLGRHPAGVYTLRIQGPAGSSYQKTVIE